MRILDIDLDFFLKGRREGHIPEGRPTDDELPPMPAFIVEYFLRTQCGLSPESRVPGAVFEEHDELFYHLRDEIARGTMTPGFELVHADAHADLGIGNCAVDFILTKWLAREPPVRTEPPRDGREKITNGNWLLYAIACRWVGSLTYVLNNAVDRDNLDIPIGLIDDEEVDDMRIVLKLVEERILQTRRLNELEGLVREPALPFRAVPFLDYVSSGQFDRVFLTRSPRYSPRAADELFDLIRTFIDERSVGTSLGEP